MNRIIKVVTKGVFDCSKNKRFKLFQNISSWVYYEKPLISYNRKFFNSTKLTIKCFHLGCRVKRLIIKFYLFSEWTSSFKMDSP